jgi:hypothetical protein
VNVVFGGCSHCITRERNETQCLAAASEDKECKEWRSRLLPNAVADYLGHVLADATAKVQAVVKPISFGA